MPTLATIIRTATVIAAATATVAGCGHLPAPPAAEPPPHPIDTPTRVTLLFGGDVMQHMPQIEAAWNGEEYDYTPTFRHLAPLFDSTDVVVLNLETTLGSGGRYSGYPMFRAPAALATAMRRAGVDIVTLANNHIADKGRRGVVSTICTLDSAGIRHTGIYADSAAYAQTNPMLFDSKGIRFALLNYTYGINGLPVPDSTVVNLIDTARISSDIASARSTGAEYLIAYFHWGYEYNRQPNIHQRRLAEWCHSKGVEFVIGSHPHVIQPLEITRDTLDGGLRNVTAYSLGNLVSNQRKRYTDGGVALKIGITRRDSVPDVIDVEYMLTWVWMPVEDGRRSYTILPSPVADTLLRHHPDAKRAYDLFVSDSRRLLGESMVREVRYRDPRATTDSLLRSLTNPGPPVSERPPEL